MEQSIPQQTQQTTESPHVPPQQQQAPTQPSAFHAPQHPSGMEPPQGSGGIFEGFKRFMRGAAGRPQPMMPPTGLPPQFPFYTMPPAPQPDDYFSQQPHPAMMMPHPAHPMMMPQPTTPFAGMAPQPMPFQQPYTPAPISSFINPYQPAYLQMQPPPVPNYPNMMMPQQPYPSYVAAMMPQNPPFGSMYEPSYYYPDTSYPYPAYPYQQQQQQQQFGFTQLYGMTPGGGMMPLYDPSMLARRNHISAVKDLWQSSLM